jgi:group I intron endonuclease
MNTGVYMIRNKITDACYIGSTAQSFSARFGSHRYHLRRNTHRNKKLQNAWRKYGEDCFEFLILEKVSQEEALDAEQRWYENFKQSGHKLYNLRSDVKSQLGMHHSPASRHKISQGNKGKIVSLRTRIKLSIIQSGKKRSDQAKANMSMDWYLVSPTGESLIIHDLNDFCAKNKFDNSAMAKVSKGLTKSYKGWTSPDARAEYLKSHPLKRPNKIEKICPQCHNSFLVKASQADRRKFCSQKCRNEHDSLAYSGTGNPNYRHGKRVQTYHTPI